MLERILEKAVETNITVKEINDIVSKYGFSESSLYFTPDVISQQEGYNLLKLENESYTSILNSKPIKYITHLQKRFLKSMLCDSRIRLFFDNHMVEELEAALFDVEPLFNLDDIIFTETALDSDDYTDEKYIHHFNTIMYAIRNNYTLRICFNNSKGERTTLKIIPYKLEYGIRDDKFRLCGISVIYEKPKRYVKVNLARILSISVRKQSYKVDFEAFISAKKKSEPIEIDVTNLRNGFERVFIGLSNYERISTFDEQTDTCRMKIYYSDDDELDLLILLLSFGPTIKVLGPTEFKNKFIDRIKNQIKMFNEP